MEISYFHDMIENSQGILSKLVTTFLHFGCAQLRATLGVDMTPIKPLGNMYLGV